MLELAEHRQEDVLDGVLGVLGGPDHPAGQAEHPRRVPAVELLAGVPLPGAAARHEAAVVVVGRSLEARAGGERHFQHPLDGRLRRGVAARRQPAQIVETADPAAGERHPFGGQALLLALRRRP